jgi:hypothetical protein
VQLLENKNFTTEADIVYRKGAANDSKAWRQAFPGFLEWEFGR